MDILYSIDVAVFRFINQSLSNPLFGVPGQGGLMSFLSWNSFFVPAVLLFAGWMLCKAGSKGRIFVAMMVLTLAIGDGVICHGLKDAFGRQRPFLVLEGVNLVVGPGGSGSMPSSHTANWFSAMAVAFLFYRRSWKFMLPMALLIGFSRVYVGVHYPSDVLVGALLGVGYAVGIVVGADALWRFIGQRWFPLWWAKCPALAPPLPWLKREAKLHAMPSRSASGPGHSEHGVPASAGLGPQEMEIAHDSSQTSPAASEACCGTQSRTPVGDSSGSPSNSRQVPIEVHWERLAYLLILVLLLARWGYIASAKIEISEDEAYQWVWSKHPALSYYSKPPFIAYAQFIGTAICGDTELGVRFLSPLLAAIMSALLFRFLKREANLRVAFGVLLMGLAMPLLAVGTILMTIDPLNVFFWTMAMMSGWQAVQRDSLKLWALTGLWMGCGFLSKYTALFQLLSFATYFAMWKPARGQVLKPGPWVALGVMLLCTLPVLVWNAQHDWITVTHLGERGGLDRAWEFKPNFIWDFLLQEFGLLNPVFFVAGIWAVVEVWRKHRDNPFLVYLFSMGVPLFLFYALYTVRSRVQPNWIAPAILPLLCLLVVYWEPRWRAGVRPVRRWLTAGLALGLPVVLVLHDTNLVRKLTGHPLPAKVDPLSRVRGWKSLAEEVNAARLKLAGEGKPVFIIGGHYGITGEVTFYLPEGRERVGTESPLVYYMTSKIPHNQFYFWPGYTNRLGENAIFVREMRNAEAAPQPILDQFTSVTDLGLRDIRDRKGMVVRKIQVFECRGLK